MQIMAIFGRKRLETVPVKFSESEKAELIKLAELEDRGVGYIVRELAFRGLALYIQDGKLKISGEEENFIEKELGDFTAKPTIKGTTNKTDSQKVSDDVNLNDKKSVKPEKPTNEKLNFGENKSKKGKSKSKEELLKKDMDKALEAEKE